MSAETFSYDVFLSHSAKDKEVVRDVAERLRKDGVKVWFDEWVLKPGDNIPHKIEEGLEGSRVLVLCMSANAFGSDWAQLESGTFRFRDPLNKERRFLPLRLDDTPIKASLAQFLYIDWKGTKDSYAALLRFCRESAPLCRFKAQFKRDENLDVTKLELQSPITALAFSCDGKKVITGSGKAVQIWDVVTGDCIQTITSHRKVARKIAWRDDGKRALIWSDEDNV
jgi:WD40 repeat protein